MDEQFNPITTIRKVQNNIDKFETLSLKDASASRPASAKSKYPFSALTQTTPMRQMNRSTSAPLSIYHGVPFRCSQVTNMIVMLPAHSSQSPTWKRPARNPCQTTPSKY
jgi:hypothetical protein